ncbi:MAG: hypothetical protein KTV68_07005 [Acidimicrobiia bacterium]|nr:hypothetical protein [Acidimicrobiia bacterium]MCY4434084.1 hypothetical protein [bacterium]
MPTAGVSAPPPPPWAQPAAASTTASTTPATRRRALPDGATAAPTPVPEQLRSGPIG